MEDLADHFRWVLKQARPGSVLLLIDDLDRCPETFVVELLDSVQKLMRDQESTIGQREQRKRQVRVRRIHHVAPSLVVIVAADGRWVRGSYDNTYASMTNAVNEPAATVGSLFLQKLFQLTVPVPRLSEGLKKEYLTGLLADQKGGQIRQPVDPELAKRVSNARPEDVLDEIAAASPLDRVRISEIAIGRLVTEPDAQEHTRHALEEYAELLEPTPRAMKRFVMAYSMLRAVRTAEGSVVDIGPLALWTIVLTRWPTLAEHLQASPAEVHLFKTPPDRLPPSTPHQLLTLFTDPPDDLRRVMNHVNGPMNEGNIRECSGQANRASTKARTTGNPLPAAQADVSSV
jgi:hypothetical protein